MLARQWLVTVVLAGCAAVAMPAHGASTHAGAVHAHHGEVLAASDDEYDEAVVAQDGDVRLGASDDESGEGLCIAIRSRHPEHRMVCSDPAHGAVSLPQKDAAGPRHVGAAVPHPAVRVEIRRGGRIVASGPAVAGATYTGKSAGAVRFALVALPAGAPTDALRVHALDGAGAIVAVLGSPAMTRSRAPADPLGAVGRHPVVDRQPFVAADVRRVTVMLGDGRWQAARTAPFGASGPLTYALSVRAGLAVRSLVLQLRSGRTRVVPVTAAPLAVACATRSQGTPQGSGGDPARFAPDADVPAVLPAGRSRRCQPHRRSASPTGRARRCASRSAIDRSTRTRARSSPQIWARH